MQTDYLRQAKSFLAQSAPKLAFRVVPMAFVAVAAAQAQPVFNAPSTTSISTITAGNNCTSGNTSGSLSGTPGTGGVSLSGNAALGNNFNGGSCGALLVWKGSGSGSLASTTAGYTANFVLTTPSNASILSYSLTLYINGVAQSPVTCSVQLQEAAVVSPKKGAKPRGFSNACGGTVTVPLTNIPVSGTLSSYEADLSVTGFWYNPQNASIAISVPSIAISSSTATVAPPATVPALSPAALAGTALLLALAAFRLVGRKTSTGTPGPEV